MAHRSRSRRLDLGQRQPSQDCPRGGSLPWRKTGHTNYPTNPANSGRLHPTQSDSVGGSKASATLIAAYTPAFAGFLRCGSFTYDAFDPAFNLARSNLHLEQTHHMCICQPTRRTPSDMGSKSISQSARQRTYVPLGCYDTLLLIGPETQKRPSFLFHLPNPYSLDPLSSQAPCYGHEGGMSPGKIHRALVSEGRCDMGFVGGVHSGGD